MNLRLWRKRDATSLMKPRKGCREYILLVAMASQPLYKFQKLKKGERMIIDMLTGVSEMLRDTKEVEVKCAKIMLDKIIDGMLKENITVVDTTPKKASPKPKPQPGQVELEMQAAEGKGEYRIIVDSQKRIKEIEGAMDTTMVELDGVPMTVKEAIGKTFVSGRIL